MNKVKTILLTGLLVGTLDGIAAIIQTMVRGRTNPENVFKFIASGVFGKPALAGGSEMVIAGVMFHYIIAMGWAVLFFLIYPRLSANWRNPYIAGILYGVFVSVMMDNVVVPLSNTPVPTATTYIGVFVLIVCVGLPAALICHRSMEVVKVKGTGDWES